MWTVDATLPVGWTERGGPGDLAASYVLRSWWLERVVDVERCSPLLIKKALPFSATWRFMLIVLALALVRQAVSRPVPLCSYGTRKLRVCAGGRLKPARPGEGPPVKVIGT